MNELILQNANRFADYLSTFSFVDEVLLFGSQVTGNVHSESDIDICIVCHGFEYVNYNSEWTLKKSKIDTRIHIVPVSKEIEANMNFYNENKNSSIVLFKRK